MSTPTIRLYLYVYICFFVCFVEFSSGSRRRGLHDQSGLEPKRYPLLALLHLAASDNIYQGWAIYR